MIVPHTQVVFELSVRQSISCLTGALAILQTTHFCVLRSTIPCDFCRISGNQLCGVISVGTEIRLEVLRQAVGGVGGGLQANFWFSIEMSACPQTLPTLPSCRASFASPISAQPSSLATPKPHSPSGLVACAFLPSPDQIQKKTSLCSSF